MRKIAFSLAIFVAHATTALAQSGDEQALARARALDACDGREVISAEVVQGNRLNVVCVGEDGVRRTGGGDGLGSGGSLLAILGLLLLAGAAGGGGGGGSAGGTN